MSLDEKRCVPCEGGVTRLGPDEIVPLLAQVSGWTAQGERLRKPFRFRSFVKAMEFVNRIAEVAEAEGHHPDFCVHYSEVDVTLWTHAAAGLTENDFILAAKLDAL